MIIVDIFVLHVSGTVLKNLHVPTPLILPITYEDSGVTRNRGNYVTECERGEKGCYVRNLGTAALKRYLS